MTKIWGCEGIPDQVRGDEAAIARAQFLCAAANLR